MSRMLWYEWKRIWQSRLTQLTVIGCGAFLVFCVWSSIVQMTAVDKSGNQVSGMQAAEALQDTQERITLDQETVNRLLEEYISYTEDLKQDRMILICTICRKKHIVHGISQEKNCSGS